MSGMEDRVSLDISEALTAIENIDAAFGRVVTDFQSQMEDALSAISTSVEISADTSTVAPSIDDAIAEAQTEVAVTPDAEQLTLGIDEAIEAAESQVTITADTSEVQDAIDAIAVEPIEIPIETQDVDTASQAFEGLSGAAEQADRSTSSAATRVGEMGVAARLASGDVGSLERLLAGIGPGGAAAAGGVAALAAATGVLFQAGLDSIAAQQRFNQILGESAAAVQQIDIGGLNEDLTQLAVRLGDDDEALQNAASTMFNLGRASGIAAPQVARVTEQAIALAARAVALNPALGDVGDVAQRLFTSLARGGRFAANFGISLSTAEINARAFADTGKTVASDLTFFDKAAAGAAITVERLGGTLATDINAGAENVSFRLRALRAQFNETLDTLGEPLVEPILGGLEDLTPALQSAAEVFGALAGAIVPVVASVVDGLAPALDSLVTPAEAVGDALGVVADALALVPTPVKAAAASFVIFNAALRAVAATRVASVLAGFGGPLSNIARFAGPAAVGLAGIATVIGVVQQQVAQGEENVTTFLDSLVEGVNNIGNLEDLETRITALASASGDLRDSADDLRGGFLGSIPNRGEIRDLENAATGIESITTASINLLNRAKALQREFGLTSAAALLLARSSEEVVIAMREEEGTMVTLTAAQAAAERSTTQFWLAAQAGALSAVDIANQAAAMGVEIEDLTSAVDEARQPILDFASGIAGALPGASAALTELGENEGLDKFVQNLEENVANAAAFVGNLQTLIDRGATDLAELLGQLAETDPEQAAKLASEAVKRGLEDLVGIEQKIDATNFGQGLVNAATQNVADQLGGGLELAAAQARERFGTALQNIPGQIDAEAEAAATSIVGGIVQSTTAADEWNDLNTDMEERGREAVQGFEDGFQDEAERIAMEQHVRRIAKSVTDAVENAFEISSPSKVMERLGKLVTEGFFIGLADVKGASEAIDPILDVVSEFELSAADIANAAGNSVDDITASLRRLGEEQEKLTPDKLLAIGDAVKALGGSKGVKELQAALAQQVSAAFGGLGAREVTEIAEQLRLAAAVQRGSGVFGVTPRVPEPFKTEVVKGADASTRGIVVQQDITVTPPPDATASEMAGEIGTASAWAFAGVTG